MPSLGKKKPSAAEPDTGALEGDSLQPKKLSYRPSYSRDSRHMCLPCAPNENLPNNDSDDESSVNSSTSSDNDSTPWGDRKPATGTVKRTSSNAAVTLKTSSEMNNTVDLLSDSEGEQEDVFNIYVAMKAALQTRANAKNGHNPAALLQLYVNLIKHKDLLFKHLNSLEGNSPEETKTRQFNATMFYSALPDDLPTTRQSRKGPIIDSLVDLWKTIRMVNMTLPPLEVITGRRRHTPNPMSVALEAYGEYTSAMLMCEYSCLNAKAERDEKRKVMKTVKVTGEFFFAIYHSDTIHQTYHISISSHV